MYKKMSLAPITLFVYNRQWHAQETVEALQENELSKESDLFIFSDGPKNDKEKENVNKVREYIKTIDGFKSINIILREKNLGLAKSIITGVTEIIDRYGKIIVMEDDLVSSPYFIKFMNDALEFYEREEKVVSIHGYIYPVKTKNLRSFFIKGSDCLGWATWKRGWDMFEQDGRKLLRELKARRLTREFDINGAYPYTRMLEGQVKGNIESWAVLWYASTFLKDRLTLYPGRSFIRHIGNDNSGTNFGKEDILDCKIADSPVAVNDMAITEDLEMRREIERFFREKRPSIPSRMLNKIWMKR